MLVPRGTFMGSLVPPFRRLVVGWFGWDRLGVSVLTRRVCADMWYSLVVFQVRVARMNSPVPNPGQNTFPSGLTHTRNLHHPFRSSLFLAAKSLQPWSWPSRLWCMKCENQLPEHLLSCRSDSSLDKGHVSYVRSILCHICRLRDPIMPW